MAALMTFLALSLTNRLFMKFVSLIETKFPSHLVKGRQGKATEVLKNELFFTAGRISRQHSPLCGGGWAGSKKCIC